MKILSIHNYYQQPGGEDVVVQQERALLRAHGDEVIEYSRTNDEIKSFGMLEKIAMAKNVIWSNKSFREIQELLKKHKPDIAHFHNTFIMVSPAAYYACREMGIPVVQTLHSYRLLCPASDFFRDGKICELCLGKTPPISSIIHNCYHDSKIGTSIVAVMLTYHRLKKTFDSQVDTYIALTKFGKEKFIQGGLPSEKISVKSNFVYPDPGVGLRDGNYGMFIGRLSPSKKVSTLLEAARELNHIPINIAGKGPEEKDVVSFIQSHQMEHVSLLGQLPREKTLSYLKSARFLIFPSEWYEGFPMTIVEAMACGIPVIASRLGAMAEIIEDGKTGLLFTPGDTLELREKILWLWEHEPEAAIMGVTARKTFLEKYSAEQNYLEIMKIYRQTINLFNKENKT